MLDHIQVREAEGRVVVTIDDYELFDYVENFLIEQCDLEYDYMTKSEDRGRSFFSIHFPLDVTIERVSSAVYELSATEIERISRLNNCD